MDNFRELLQKHSVPLLVGFLGGLVGALVLSLFWQPLSLTREIIKQSQEVTVEENSATITAVEKILPSVVSITSSREVQSFFGQVFKVSEGGTGFVVDENGLIATNKHVVSDSGADYEIVTASGKNLKGRVVAQDPSNDLALIEVNEKNLTPVVLGSSENLKIGQRVIAVGNALGQYQNTVTSGIISAIGRVIVASDGGGGTERLENIIQTDASINPGNSGGPLVNLEGQVVGVNTAVDISGQLIGFAIPVSYLKSALQSYQSSGKVIRPRLGVRYINLNEEIAESYNLERSQGAWLVRGEEGESAVAAGGPADKAGLKEGDIILKINDDSLTEKSGLLVILQKYKPGDVVDLLVFRNSREMHFSATLGEAS